MKNPLWSSGKRVSKEEIEDSLKNLGRYKKKLQNYKADYDKLDKVLKRFEKAR